MSQGPLADVSVLDLSSFVTGGFASVMLANLGADVVKIEQPDRGDDARYAGPPFVDGESPYFWTVNYDKKSLELDLKSDEGLDVFYDLVEQADVVLENFRPGTAERIGVGYDTLTEYNDSLVFCSISAFGESGPWKDRTGYDLLIQGMSGIMSVTGEEDGPPVKVGVPISDLVTGMWAAFGISSALRQRERTGTGDYIEVGMYDAMLPWLTKQAAKAFLGEDTGRMGARDPVLSPYQRYETADGYINLACGNQRTWERLCEALGREDLLDDDRFEDMGARSEHMDALEAELEAELTERPTEEWVELLADEYGIPAGPIHSVENALDNEHVEARDLVQSATHTAAGDQPVVEHPLKFEQWDAGFDQHAPVLGEHSEEILRKAGYTQDDIEELRRENVVKQTGLEDDEQ